MLRLPCSLAGLIFLASLTPALADPVDDASALDRFVASPVRLNGLTREVVKALPAYAGSCRIPEPKTRTTVKVLQPLTFTPEGVAVRGVFLERVTVNLCGRDLTLNVLGQAMSNGDLRRFMLLPGETLADPRLQRDAVKTAQSASLAALKGKEVCKEARVTDTRITQPLQEGRWTETWDLSWCGQTVPVDMAFTKTADGTDFRATSHAATAAR